MSKRILSLLLALVLLVGLVPFGTLPAHAAIPDNEKAWFTVSADGKDLQIVNKGDNVVVEGGSYTECPNHAMNPADWDQPVWGCTIVYPVGTKAVTLNLEDWGDLWKSDGSLAKCVDVGEYVMSDV